MRTIQIADKTVAYELKYTKTLGIRMMYRPENDPPFIVHANRFTGKLFLESFLRKNAAWILSCLNKPKEAGFYLLGKKRDVRLEKGAKNTWNETDGIIVFTVKDPKDDETLEKLVKKVWKAYLEEYVESRRALYEQITGKKNVVFSYRAMHTEYGSCHPKSGRITLNLQLACLPSAYIDAIVFHEYAHFKVLNHSEAFYRVLEGYYPAYRKIRREMRNVSFKNPVKCVRESI